LSWKHLVEGTKNSLKRLKLDYVDLLYCHRPDPTTPIEETVRAMDYLIKSGHAFYWGTSEWGAAELEEAFDIAETYGCIRPTMEQPQYNMLHRERMEVEYLPIFEKYGMGTTIWSPLASGILTGKYNNGIPAGSRLEKHDWLREKLTPEVIAKLNKLEGVAKELGATLSQLAIAWCLCNPNVSTVILGATSVKQLDENIQAVSVRDAMKPDVLRKIDGIIGGV
jgi:aryl-alcohol dehydrogenase-like predicted oxidoreductase